MEKPQSSHETHSGDTSIERIAIRLRKELDDTRHRFGAPSAADSDGYSSIPRKANPADSRTWWLVIEAGGKPFQVKISKPVVVLGRHPTCDLRIPSDSVSRFHCKVTIQGDRLHVEDLKSRNGTFHNGRRILESDVASGEQITLGPVTFRAMCVDPDALPGKPGSDDSNPGETSFGLGAIK